MTIKIDCLIMTVLILLATGCTIEQTVKYDAVRLPVAPAVKQIPIHIGVYYSPEFIEYKKRIELIGCGLYGRPDKSGIFYIFPIGTASKDLFEQTLSSMFTAVTGIPEPPQSAKNKLSVDGVLEPRIESFNWDIVCSQDYLSAGKYSTIVKYLINVYDSKGHFVTSMHVEGRALKKPKICLGQSCQDVYGTEQAMKDAIAKFLIDFQEQPEVKQRLLTGTSAPGKEQ